MSRDRPTDPSSDDRQARLGAALRANLARRKAQARQRADEAPDGQGGDPTNDPEPQDGTAPNPAASED